MRKIKMAVKLKPIVKWAGGKEQELKFIKPEMPKEFDRFFEPFVGGGAVYFNVGNPHPKFINDKSIELINLYKSIANDNGQFHELLAGVIGDWDFITTYVLLHKDELNTIYTNFREDLSTDVVLREQVNAFFGKHNDLFTSILVGDLSINAENFRKELNKSLLSKLTRMKKIEVTKTRMPEGDILDNIEGAIKAAYYMHVRNLYNNAKKLNISTDFYEVIFFFIRNYAYSGMFRYNAKGEFNVPYGGIGYNKKSLAPKLSYIKDKSLIAYLKETEIFNLDFEDFFKQTRPKDNDFIFLDPPYDTEFSTYAQNEFNKDDQARLANYLLNECNAKWMIVIKNTPFIYDLYNKEHLNMSSFSKKYLVSFQNRNDKNAEHLLIRNYV